MDDLFAPGLYKLSEDETIYTGEVSYIAYDAFDLFHEVILCRFMVDREMEWLCSLQKKLSIEIAALEGNDTSLTAAQSRGTSAIPTALLNWTNAPFSTSIQTTGHSNLSVQGSYCARGNNHTIKATGNSFGKATQILHRLRQCYNNHRAKFKGVNVSKLR